MGGRLNVANNEQIALPRIAVDVSALRASRDLRLLILGNWVTGLGTQAALVALPFQLYEQTRSAFLTGLLGAVELVPWRAGGGALLGQLRGLACIVGAIAVVAAFPALIRYDAEREIAAMPAAQP